MFFIEHPIPSTLAADSTAQVLANWNAVYDAHNEVACLMLRKEGKSVCSYVLQMKGYVEKLERLGYVLPQDLSVGLILNGLTSDFVEHPTKGDACHHCKEVGHWKRNYPAYHAELIKKKKKVGTASSLVSKNDVLYFNVILRDGIYEIDMLNLVPNVNSIYNVSNKRAKHNLDSTYLWHCRLAHISKKHRGGEYISQEFKDYLKACGIVQQLTPPYTPQHNGVSERRNHTLLDMVRSMMNLTTLPLSYWDYALESATPILNMVPTKKVDKTPYELWYGKVPNLSYLKVWETMGYYFYFPPENKIVIARYAEFLEKNRISQKFSGRAEELEEIQDEDTSPSENTSEIPMKVEDFKPPQEEVILVRRFARTHRAPDRLILNVEVEEHSLGDLNEPTNYKVAMLDPESNKWLDAMNAEMQSTKDNKVWRLVDLPSNGKIVGSKWLFKKKTDIDGNVHTYKDRLVAKSFTQNYEVDYEETFSPVANIRAIRILIAIAAFYDYEIWQMDVKTTFLNGYLDEYIYMVQPEGFIDLKHHRKVCKLQRSIYGLKQASIS
ncbi:retrotransposon protein, putative, ty1-copia subclass [Tanacetum coccineum]